MHKILLLLTNKIIEWKTTPQLRLHREMRRKELIRAFLIYINY